MTHFPIDGLTKIWEVREDVANEKFYRFDGDDWVEYTPPYSIPDGSITTAKLDDWAVTTDKIADEAVIDTKIADDAVVTRTIKDENVTPEKLSV